MSRKRWIFILALLGVCTLFLRYCVRIVPPDAPPTREDSSRSALAVPVAGVARTSLLDTYSQSREQGARVHNAIDIPAPRGTPVVAAAPGTVEKLFRSERGGNSIYVRSADRRWTYYYAHLDSYDPALREGQRIAAGATLGTVGSTGNAAESAPHLHFAINRMQPAQRWFEGQPINPYPLLMHGNR